MDGDDNDSDKDKDKDKDDGDGDGDVEWQALCRYEKYIPHHMTRHGNTLERVKREMGSWSINTNNYHCITLYHLLALPPRQSQPVNALAGMRLGRVLVLGRVRVRILPLIQIPQRVVHFPVLGLVRAHIH